MFLAKAKLKGEEIDLYEGGRSQNMMWYQCNDNYTLEYLIEQIPDLDPPAGRSYRYVVNGPDDRPYRYVTGQFKKEMWEELLDKKCGEEEPSMEIS